MRELGPGLITGAADDDPSGIATYTQAGATFGYGLLWTAILCMPLMVAVQTMCARVGVVAERGLASVLRTNYSRWLLWLVCLLLFAGNTIIHVLADKQPDGFEPVEGGLEDVYFSTLSTLRRAA